MPKEITGYLDGYDKELAYRLGVSHGLTSAQLAGGEDDLQEMMALAKSRLDGMIKSAKFPDLELLLYRDYLRTDVWMAIRNDALDRAEHKCQTCGKKKHPPDVHHNNYPPRGEEKPADLVVLCRRCHALFHGKQPS